ncbi:MAG: glycosyltransferase family 2 protein [Desulfobulbus sp.]|nr:MAG: glycosyltransferase family 2 protein [Desulfobulbus sp.]RUM40474.1 MAG: glycosyltransferase family 2 protein [Desulfobulbus sp.]
MLSVIIPTFNRAGFIYKALLSVVRQTCPCGEIIVVDDGSTDRTGDVVQRFSAKYNTPVRYFYQKNSGVSAARNRGIAEAANDILCFLDSDDWWDERKLALQSAAMAAAPEYLISHTRETWYRRGELVNQKKKHAPPHGDIFSRALAMCVVGMSTVMVRRQLFEEYGFFDETLLCCEDYDLWLRVSAKEEFLLIDEPLTLKDGGRPDQLSVIHRLGMDTWRIRSLCNLLEHCGLQEEQYQLALAELRRKCTIYGNGCIKHGRPEEGQRYLDLPRQFIKHTP